MKRERRREYREKDRLSGPPAKLPSTREKFGVCYKKTKEKKAEKNKVTWKNAGKRLILSYVRVGEDAGHRPAARPLRGEGKKDREPSLSGGTPPPASERKKRALRIRGNPPKSETCILQG